MLEKNGSKNFMLRQKHRHIYNASKFTVTWQKGCFWRLLSLSYHVKKEKQITLTFCNYFYNNVKLCISFVQNYITYFYIMTLYLSSCNCDETAGFSHETPENLIRQLPNGSRLYHLKKGGVVAMYFNMTFWLENDIFMNASTF